MKKFAYCTSKITEHNYNVYPALCNILGFDNLYEGEELDILDLEEYVMFFKKHSNSLGLYITEKDYKEYSDSGLHFYYWDTILNILNNYWQNKNLALKVLVKAQHAKVIVKYGKGLFFEEIVRVN